MATLKQIKMAKLFVRGPYQGQWEAAAKAAGYKKVPSTSLPALRELIAREGGNVPTFFQPTPSPTQVPHNKVEEISGEETEELVLPELDLPTPDDPDADSKWRLLAEQVMPIWRNIAIGNIEANATQRQVLQSILDRGFGKVGTRKEVEEESDVRVLVLPALGGGAGLHICPRCGYEEVEEDD